MANRIFFVLMALASALALVRGFVLAGLLPVEGFGRYAMLFAIGTFAASLLSFGMIERSYKRFPRLCADGLLASALAEADRIVMKLAVRALVILLACVAILVVADRLEWLLASIIAIAVAFGAAVQSAYVSLQRADGELASIGIASLGRAIVTLALGACGAFALGWSGALLGEISGGLLGGWISRMSISKKSAVGKDFPKNAATNTAITTEQKELWTFVGFLGAAVPLYLDRTIVTMLLGHEATGVYALLMLFVMGVYTATSVVSQKVGPDLIRMQKQGAAIRTQLRVLGQWCAGLAGLGILGMLIMGWLLIDGPLQFLAVRYDLNWQMLVAATILAALQISHLPEWMLLSHDAERSVFIATLVLLMSLAGAVFFVAHVHGDIVMVLCLFAGAKFLQLTSLIVLILVAIRSKSPGSNASQFEQSPISTEVSRDNV